MLHGKVVNHTIETTTCGKEAASYTILHAQSCHPMHTEASVLIGELIKANRNCSMSLLICNHLREQKYPDWMLKWALTRTDHMDRDALLAVKKVSPLMEKYQKLSILRILPNFARYLT